MRDYVVGLWQNVLLAAIAGIGAKVSNLNQKDLELTQAFNDKYRIDFIAKHASFIQFVENQAKQARVPAKAKIYNNGEWMSVEIQVKNQFYTVKTHVKKPGHIISNEQTTHDHIMARNIIVNLARKNWDTGLNHITGEATAMLLANGSDVAVKAWIGNSIKTYANEYCAKLIAETADILDPDPYTPIAVSQILIEANFQTKGFIQWQK